MDLYIDQCGGSVFRRPLVIKGKDKRRLSLRNCLVNNLRVQLSLWTGYTRPKTGIWSTSESFRRRLRELFKLDM